jgi:glutamine phosphoribosylpyrophosphate amidotransferase
MCGIAGFFAPPNERADPALVARMIDTLRHRGPDATGIFTEGRVGLGVSRLRVLDLVGGDQPLGTEDGAVQVALNGEIYNFASLRERLRARGHRFTTASDTEVVAHVWDEQGSAAIEEPTDVRSVWGRQTRWRSCAIAWARSPSTGRRHGWLRSRPSCGRCSRIPPSMDAERRRPAALPRVRLRARSAHHRARRRSCRPRTSSR